MPAKDLLAYAFSSLVPISFFLSPFLPSVSHLVSLFLSHSTFSSFPSFLFLLFFFFLLVLPRAALLLDKLVPLANVRSFERRRAAARRSPLLNARARWRANLVIFYASRFLFPRANWTAI